MTLRRARRTAVIGAALVAGACAPAGVEGYALVVDGDVADADGVGVPDAVVAVLGADGGALGEATTDAAGTWAWPLLGTEPEDNTLAIRVSADGYGHGDASYAVSLLSAEVATLAAGPGQTWDAVHRPLACVRLDGAADAPKAAGRIVDAEGVPVGGVAGVVQRGWDAAVGAAAEASFVTDADGRFDVEVGESGLYTVYVAPTGGWAGARFPVLTAVDHEAVVGTLAPLQEPGRLYAVLRWVGNLDLDLHLTAPERDADAIVPTQRFHVWADEPSHVSRTDDEATAEMLRTSTTGSGPEVVVINTPVGAGELRLSVHDRTNADEGDSATLGGSRALVQWWYGEDVARYAWVDPLARATTWRPVEVDTRGGTVFAVEGYRSGVDPTDPDSF